jgi:hypothetical protein
MEVTHQIQERQDRRYVDEKAPIFCRLSIPLQAASVKHNVLAGRQPNAALESGAKENTDAA